MVNLEREYKFGLPNNWQHLTLLQYPLVNKYLTEIRRFDMSSQDYDTEDGWLDAGGHSLRIRRENDSPVCTLKVLREDDGNGKRVRDEYEVADDISINVAIAVFKENAKARNDTQCLDIISHLHGTPKGVMIFRNRDFLRYDLTVQYLDVTLSIAIDIGAKITYKKSGEKVERIRKIDLEYKDGNINTFEAYVNNLEQVTGLRRITEAKVTDLDYDLL